MNERKPDTMMKMLRTNPVSPALVIPARICFQKLPLLQTFLSGLMSYHSITRRSHSFVVPTPGWMI